MNKCRKLSLIESYTPCIAIEDEEIFCNGIFCFNISRILQDINAGKLDAEREDINIIDWYRMHSHGLIDPNHLPTVDITKPIIQAEIRLGRYEIIDRNHRLEKAYGDNI